MGMNFTAYIGHSMKRNEIEEMCNLLNNHHFKYTMEFIEELQKHNEHDGHQTWHVRLDDFGGTIELRGPFGLEFTFSEHVCMIMHYTRWLTFVLNDLEVNFQTYLRNISIELMEYFNSSYTIYVPDSGTRESGIMDFIWDDENRDIEYIREWLFQKCGKPKNSIIEIYKDQGETWKSDGYFIERKRDFIECNSKLNDAPDIL